jgi:enolase-phosphatase E1
VNLSAAGIGVVLLDIEGTTTPIAFVHDVLFPYARARMRAFLNERASDSEIQQVLDDLRREQLREVEFSSPESADQTSIVRYIYWLMDRDRKSGPLKALQGKIWELGYASGELKGEVYPDVPAALERWTAAGVRVGIFSSGSVLAQKLLFRNSSSGDLTRFLRWYFDTSVGPKVDTASYRRIVDALHLPADRILFVSDIVTELDAARMAGLQTLLSIRPPARMPVLPAHPAIRSFDDIAA